MQAVQAMPDQSQHGWRSGLTDAMLYVPQKNKTLVPNSFDAYVAAVLEYSTVTSGDDSLVSGEAVRIC